MVAVEPNRDLMTELPPGLRLSEEDALYICGTNRAVNLYYEE